MNHVARRKEGRTPGHDIVNQHDSLKVGSEVAPPSKRSTEGGDIWSLAARQSMRPWNDPGPFEKLLDIAPQTLLVKGSGKAESRPEGVIRSPRCAAWHGHQGSGGAEDALEGRGLPFPAQSRDTLKNIAAGILHPTHDLSRPDAGSCHVPEPRRVD